MDNAKIQKIMNNAPIEATHYATLRRRPSVACYVKFERAVYWVVPPVIPASINIMIWKVYPLNEINKNTG